MDINLLFKIAAIGILVAVLYQVLVRAGREDQAMMTTLAGLVIVLTMVIKEISTLFNTVRTIFGKHTNCQFDEKDNVNLPMKAINLVEHNKNFLSPQKFCLYYVIPLESISCRFRIEAPNGSTRPLKAGGPGCFAAYRKLWNRYRAKIALCNKLDAEIRGGRRHPEG